MAIFTVHYQSIGGTTADSEVPLPSEDNVIYLSKFSQ